MYEFYLRKSIKLQLETLSEYCGKSEKNIQRDIYIIVNVNNVLLTEISYLLSFCNLLKKVTLEILHQMSEIFSS